MATTQEKITRLRELLDEAVDADTQAPAEDQKLFEGVMARLQAIKQTHASGCDRSNGA